MQSFGKKALTALPIVRIASLCFGLLSVTTGWAQTLSTVRYKSVTGAEPSLQADFFLPDADTVTSVDVSTGSPMSKDKAPFTQMEKIPGYHCALFLLVDKTLGNEKGISPEAQRKIWKEVKDSLTRFASAAQSTSCLTSIGTISAGNVESLAGAKGGKSIIDEAIRQLKFDGRSPELYQGAKSAIGAFGQADRKFLVIFSNGLSNDQVTSQADLIQAAREANVHICTIGFPAVNDPANSVQNLQKIAAQTNGYSVVADGRELRLPPDAENNMVKFATSGGIIKVDLTGLNSPLELQFTVNTGFNRVYTFSHTVDDLPPVPTPSPAISSSPTPKPIPTPVPSILESPRAWILSHLIVAIAGLVLIVAAVALIVLFGVRAVRKKPVVTTTPPLPIDPADLQVEEPTAQAWLLSLDSEQTRYPLIKSAIRIGRRPDNDIVMKNDSISGHHAEIIQKGNQFIIADLNSANNVLVGGVQIDKATLQNGDIVELGEVRLRFVKDDSE
jgi:hypothetical protein